MRKYVLDTNVYIHAMRNDLARAELAAWQRRMAPHLHMHAMVVTELLIGARNEATFTRWHERWVAPTERVGRIFTATYGSWLGAARIVVKLGQAGLLDTGTVPARFLNDCLLAASAREHGFTLITHNLADFRLIKRVEARLNFVPPFP